jgi:hypothetical protein
MNKRPRLKQAIEALTSLSHISDEAKQALQDYADMRAQGLDFEACRMVVDIIDQHYKLLDEKGIAHG